jgi:hypothetical protein
MKRGERFEDDEGFLPKIRVAVKLIIRAWCVVSLCCQLLTAPR